LLGTIKVYPHREIFVKDSGILNKKQDYFYFDKNYFFSDDFSDLLGFKKNLQRTFQNKFDPSPLDFWMCVCPGYMNNKVSKYIQKIIPIYLYDIKNKFTSTGT
jgi:hypothetical protein